MDVTNDVVEAQARVESAVEALFCQSDYDSVYGAIARKSMRRAQLLDRNISVSKAIKKVMIGMEIFASEHHCAPDDLAVDAKLTHDGRIVVTMRRL